MYKFNFLTFLFIFSVELKKELSGKGGKKFKGYNKFNFSCKNSKSEVFLIHCTLNFGTIIVY